MMSCADTVKRVRNALDLDQQSFAEKLGLTKSAIYNYEMGLRKPKPPIIVRMKNLAKENNIELSADDLLS